MAVHTGQTVRTDADTRAKNGNCMGREIERVRWKVKRNALVKIDLFHCNACRALPWPTETSTGRIKNTYYVRSLHFHAEGKNSNLDACVYVFFYSNAHITFQLDDY